MHIIDLITLQNCATGIHFTVITYFTLYLAVEYLNRVDLIRVDFFRNKEIGNAPLDYSQVLTN